MAGNQFSSISLKNTIGNLFITASISKSFLATYPSELESQEEGLFHFHTQYEIFFVGNEPLILEANDTEYTFRNAAFLIPPFVKHFVKTRVNAYCFCFSFKQGAGAEHDAYTGFSALFDRALTPLMLDVFSFECLSRLETACHGSSSLYEEEAKTLLKLIFLSLYENNTDVHAGAESTAINDYCIVIDHFIYNHYTENITLATVAEALHLSTKQTSRIIRKKYHTTLSALLNEKRLNVAARMLQNTDKPITEIATHLFYRSENYFFKLFREKYGCSPLAYRKKHREG